MHGAARRRRIWYGWAERHETAHAQGVASVSAREVFRYLAQGVLYLPFMVAIGYFSTRPAYRQLAPDEALIRLSLSHAAQRKIECRQRTPEELAKLSPNMRAPLDCPRERAPLAVTLDLDGKRVVDVVVPPSGLTKDGAATVYARLPVTAGKHRFVARLRDRAEGDFNYVREAELELKSGRVLVIDFHAARGGFEFRL